MNLSVIILMLQMAISLLSAPNMTPQMKQQAIAISNEAIAAAQEVISESQVVYTPFPKGIGAPIREIPTPLPPATPPASCSLTGTIHKPPQGLFWDSQTGAIRGAKITFTWTLNNIPSSTPVQLYAYGVDYNGKEWLKIINGGYGWNSFNAYKLQAGDASCYAYFPDSYTSDPDGNTSFPTPVETYQPAS